MRTILLIMIGLSSLIWADVPRFYRDADGVVTDAQTNLQWQDDYSDNNDTIKSANWANAIEYCEDLDLGDKDDWRLPNFNELYYLADRSIYNPALSGVFVNFYSSGYWSSTTLASNTGRAWGVSFNDGDDNWYVKSDSYYVRCVRAGQ